MPISSTLRLLAEAHMLRLDSLIEALSASARSQRSGAENDDFDGFDTRNIDSLRRTGPDR